MLHYNNIGAVADDFNLKMIHRVMKDSCLNLVIKVPRIARSICCLVVLRPTPMKPLKYYNSAFHMKKTNREFWGEKFSSYNLLFHIKLYLF